MWNAIRTKPEFRSFMGQTQLQLVSPLLIIPLDSEPQAPLQPKELKIYGSTVEKGQVRTSAQALMMFYLSLHKSRFCSDRCSPWRHLRKEKWCFVLLPLASR
jgi:hypothetical protein